MAWTLIALGMISPCQGFFPLRDCGGWAGLVPGSCLPKKTSERRDVIAPA